MPRTDPDKVKLLHGPYRCPRLRRGKRRRISTRRCRSARSAGCAWC
jgi:hypothetical protein